MTQEDHDAFCIFHARLRILLNIDKDELVGAMVLDEEDLDGWISFRENPWRFFIKAGTDVAERLWEIIRQREYEAEIARDERLFAPKCKVCQDGNDLSATDEGSTLCRACGMDCIPF